MDPDPTRPPSLPARPSRREVLVGAAAAAALGLGPVRDGRTEEPGPLPSRPFGLTGARTSLLGLGCFPLGGLRDEAAAVAVVVGEGGPVEALVRAREEGLVRFLGVTGHADPVVMRDAIRAWPFDAILFPLNCVDLHHLSFQQGTLPAAVERGIARVAMKVFASGRLVKKGLDAELCLRYVCGLDVSTIIVGCRTVEEVDLAVRVAREDRPLDDQEKKRLLDLSLPHRGKDVEWYKRA